VYNSLTLIICWAHHSTFAPRTWIHSDLPNATGLQRCTVVTNCVPCFRFTAVQLGVIRPFLREGGDPETWRPERELPTEAEGCLRERVDPVTRHQVQVE